MLSLDVLACAAALRADFTALAPRPRSDAPAPVEVKLHWQGAGLLEGVLELTLLDDDIPLLRMRTHDLALAGGTQTLRLLLPPKPDRDFNPTTEAKLRFIARKQTIELGRFPVSAAAGYRARSFLIGVCGAAARPADGAPRPWQHLRFERFIAADNGRNDAKFASAPMLMEAEDLPASPLALCAFDLVLLEGGSFARLREKQLAALARWVEGGGALCIIANGAIPDEQFRFLENLASGTNAKPAFARDENTRLRLSPGNLVRVRAELGRVVVTTQPPVGERDAAWADAAAFLWGMPPDTKPFEPADTRSEPIAGNAPAPKPAAPQPASGPQWQQPKTDEQRREAVRQYLNNLLPQSTQLIPLPVVSAILGAFVLLVGPGDWFVLGWLKHRRWTWLTFPIVAAAFTALTVVAAEHYLGSEDSRSALIVTDVGRGGRVLRESRLELLFAARDKDVATELRQTLAAPTRFGTQQYWQSAAPAGPPLFDGQFPARATLRQRLQQWTPQINRLLTFETNADTSGIRWDAVSAKELAAKPNPTRWFAENAGQKTGFDFAVIHEGKSKNAAASNHPNSPFLETLCILPRDFQGRAQPATAPSGDADLGDLPLIAHDDPRTWLVTAIKRAPGEIRIYRRIYRTDDGNDQ